MGCVAAPMGGPADTHRSLVPRQRLQPAFAGKPAHIGFLIAGIGLQLLRSRLGQVRRQEVFIRVVIGLQVPRQIL
jgi:hypothetical protein